ncbi:MAG: alpha/beta hydrolase [Candidatus Bathycorpusculaceae bacterium]
MKTEEVWINCEGLKLYGELHIPDNVPAPALLICHGMNARGFHSLEIYAKLARAACEKGFVSLLFDFRGVGKSLGNFDYGFGEQEDVKCALNYLASREEVISNRIFVAGHSLGGAVSLYSVQNDNRVRGLVLWSTPNNHDHNVKKFITHTRGKLGLYWFMLFSWIDKLIDISKLFKLEVYGIKLRPKNVRSKLMKLNECEAVSKLDALPLLVVIGDADPIVSVEEARQVFDLAKEPKTFLVVNGADHIYSGKKEVVINETLNWIKKWK